jgi:Major Facilitator Superfamily
MFCQSESLWVAQLSRFIMGAGSACAFLSTLKLTSTWFLPSQFALITGLTVMMGKMGGASQSLMSRGVVAYGWQSTVFTLGLIGILVTVLCWLFIKDKPDIAVNAEPEIKAQTHPPLKPILNTKHIRNISIVVALMSIAIMMGYVGLGVGIKVCIFIVLLYTLSRFTELQTVLKTHQVWIIGLVGGLMYIPITGFAELWAVPYMMTVCEIDSRAASDISALLYFGFALGSPTFAVISRKLNCHLLAMKLSCFLAMLIFGFVCFFPQYISLVGMRCLFFFGGFSMAGQVLCFSVAKEHTNISVGGTTIGFTNTLVMLSGMIMQPLVGYILDLGWEGTVSETGIRIYSKAAYQTAAIAIPLGMFCCLFLLRMLRQHKNKGL